jgi:hypothetical protein
VSARHDGGVALVPGFVFLWQGGARELNFGSLLRFNLQQESKYTGLKKPAYMYIGLYCRPGDALTPIFQLEKSPYSASLSYDVNISKLVAASKARGGIEIALRYAPFNHFKPTYNMPSSSGNDKNKGNE